MVMSKSPLCLMQGWYLVASADSLPDVFLVSFYRHYRLWKTRPDQCFRWSVVRRSQPHYCATSGTLGTFFNMKMKLTGCDNVHVDPLFDGFGIFTDCCMVVKNQQEIFNKTLKRIELSANHPKGCSLTHNVSLWKAKVKIPQAPLFRLVSKRNL